MCVFLNLPAYQHSQSSPFLLLYGQIGCADDSMDFVTSHFGKMNLWPVEHFFNIFVLTFGCVCYCTQQTHIFSYLNNVWTCFANLDWTMGRLVSSWLKVGVIFWQRGSTVWNNCKNWIVIELFVDKISKEVNIQRILVTM